MNEIIFLLICTILLLVSIILFIATLIVNRNTRDIVRRCNLDIYEVYGVMKDIHDRLKAEDENIPTLVNGSYTEKLGDKYIKATIDENIN